MLRFLVRSLLPVALLAGVCGCGSAVAPPSQAPVNVSGKVLIQSKPLSNASITFYPQFPNGMVTGGFVDKDGKFSFTCTPGKYKVTLGPIGGNNPIEGSGSQLDPANKKDATAIPTTYRDAVKTPLNIDVPETGKEDLTFDLK